MGENDSAKTSRGDFAYAQVVGGRLECVPKVA
jgi:hypothetical protein